MCFVIDQSADRGPFGCGSSGRAHKRDCLMNFRRRRLPQSPGESKPDTAHSPPSNPGPPSVRSPDPECVVIDDVSPPPTEQARPQIKLGITSLSIVEVWEALTFPAVF